jgi:uncharacterized membrane protein
VTITFSPWSAIGWTLEIVLLLFVIVLLRALATVNKTLKTTVEDMARAKRMSREQFGRGGSAGEED